MSRRLAHLRTLLLLSFASLGVAVACRATRPEGEPLGPRPEPVVPTTNPVPKSPDPEPPGPTGPTFPVPDAPPRQGPITVRAVPAPILCRLRRARADAAP